MSSMDSTDSKVLFIRNLPAPVNRALDGLAGDQRKAGHVGYSSKTRLTVAVLQAFFTALAECRAGANPSSTFARHFETLYHELYGGNDADAATGP